MGRSLQVLLLTTACVFLGAAWAQRVKLQVGGTVVFAPTDEAYLTALDCQPPACLQPTPASPAITLRVQRQRPPSTSYTLSTFRSPWSPGGGLELFARYLVEGVQSPAYTTEWVPIELLPVDLFSGSDPVTNVQVEYRLRLSGDEQAGVYETDVFYQVGPERVSHLVQVVLEPILVLRIEGVLAGADAAVSFDYGNDVLGYLQAVLGGTPLAFTDSDVDRVEIFTNNPSGYTVSVSARLILGPAGSTLELDDVLLGGAPVAGQRFVSARATGGFEVLVVPGDFTVVVDGTEAPGLYRFEITYQAEMNP